VVLLIVAVGAPLAQDWLPFHLAAKLAAAGRWEALYPPATATSLFDVPQAYEDLARHTFSTNGATAFRPETLTAFVSPPPAAFLLALLRDAPWRTSMIVMRLALALPLCGALLLFGERVAGSDPRARWQWSRICLLGSPLFMYAIASGQPSAWTATACILSALPATVGLEIAGGTALALAVLTKATPAVVVVGLWVVGRRRIASVAMALAVAAFVASSPFTGIDAWRAFAGISVRLGRTVITDWNNMSIDAMMLRSATQAADAYLHQPDEIGASLSWLGRGVLFLAAVWSASRPRASMIRRVSAVWVIWLAATPLLWLHYATALIPLLGSTSIRHRRSAAVLAGLLSSVLLMRIYGAGSVLVGNVASAAWLTSAAWLLSGRAWVPLSGPASPGGNNPVVSDCRPRSARGGGA
jgi:hypothetical protein